MEIMLLNQKIMPFLFEEIDGQYLLTNMFREYIFLSKNSFSQFLSGSISTASPLYDELHEKKFLYDGEIELTVDDYSKEYKQQNRYLFSATTLHIFVLTQNCNLACVYCQVTSDENLHKKTLMDKNTAAKSVDIALQSPSRFLAFEFQGGEPLLNFEILKFIVDYANSRKADKDIEYRLVTNLTLMTDDILDFIIQNNISISVSLDGDEVLHDINRPLKNGKGTYRKIKSWITKIKEQPAIKISAIPTITSYSLKHVDEILNTYLELGFDNIFIRNLSPFGSAVSQWEKIGYSVQEFGQFYRDAFERILSYNKKGVVIAENYASIILRKIINKQSVNFMDLRSPCGAGIGQIAYNWDGEIYTCDEGRMVAAEGDTTFKIGSVEKDNYKSCVTSSVVRYTLSASVLDNLAECKDCVYSPICGVCPVYNYKVSKSLFVNMANDYRCGVFKEIYKAIYLSLRDPNIVEIYKKWVSD